MYGRYKFYPCPMTSVDKDTYLTRYLKKRYKRHCALFRIYEYA